MHLRERESEREKERERERDLYTKNKGKKIDGENKKVREGKRETNIPTSIKRVREKQDRVEVIC